MSCSAFIVLLDVVCQYLLQSIEKDFAGSELDSTVKIMEKK